jgi:hypothetical protein
MRKFIPANPRGGVAAPPASWVIVQIATGEAIAETFLQHVAEAINRDKYKTVPIGEYLGDLNRRIKAGEIDHVLDHGGVFAR